MQAFPYIIKHTHNIKVTTIIAPQCLQLSLSTPIPNKENHKVLINRQSLRRCTIFFKLLWQRRYKSSIIILLSKIFFLVGDMFFPFLQPKIFKFWCEGELPSHLPKLCINLWDTSCLNQICYRFHRKITTSRWYPDQFIFLVWWRAR